MKKLAAVLLCVGLCISIAVLLPQTGTSNPTVDETGCLVSGCHEAGFGEGTLHGSHPIDCDNCHESASGGGPVNSSSCLACHPEADSELCDLAIAHPEAAGCLAMGCHADCEVTEGCVVTIACGETDLCPDDDCTTCTATTECDGMEADGVYSWSINGAAATGDNGSIEVCPEDLNDGDNTLTVVDTANDDAEDTETVTFNGSACQGTTECLIDVLREDFPKSNWTPLYPVLIRIEVAGAFRDDLNFFSKIDINCESDDNGLFPAILKTGKVVVPSLGTNTTMIWQTALIWPALLTGNFGEESETCTVQVAGCDATDTFELDILSIGGIPLGE